MLRADAVLNLTSVAPPAQRPVLPEDSAHGVPVVTQRHGPLSAEPLLVVSEKGAVADLRSCREKRHKSSTP